MKMYINDNNRQICRPSRATFVFELSLSFDVFITIWIVARKIFEQPQCLIKVLFLGSAKNVIVASSKWLGKKRLMLTTKYLTFCIRWFECRYPYMCCFAGAIEAHYIQVAIVVYKNQLRNVSTNFEGI